MSQQFFEVEKGLSIDGLVAFLTGAGAPAGTAGSDSALAGVGSQYLDHSSGDLYTKKLAGAGADRWQRLASSSEIATLSWREPVLCADTVSTVLPTKAALEAAQGVVLANGSRVLFTALVAAGANNIYVWDGANFVEEVSNQESTGDMTYVVDGLSAGKTYGYSKDSVWVVIGQQDATEIAFIRAFIGKDSNGNVLPSYSSAFYINNGDTLLTAAGKLDTALKGLSDALSNEITTRSDNDAAQQAEIDAIEAGAGLNANGGYTPNGASNYLGTATSLKSADNLLDAQLKLVDDAVQSLQTTVAQDGALLDDARTEKAESAVTTTITVDEVTVQQVDVVKWIVYARGSDSGDAGNRQVIEILALHDGTLTVDATNVDHTKYAKLKMGNITGLTINVDLTGAGALQKLRLRVGSTMPVEVRSVREVVRL